jgi:hypothetical protein
MGLFCDSGFDSDGFDWWWQWDRSDAVPLATKRSRKCCSCGEKIKVGEPAVTINRLRNPVTEVEERIYGEDGEVYMADWHLCDKCNDLALSLDELGFCFELGNGESLQRQIDDYRREEQASRRRVAELRTTHNAE